MLLVAIFAVPVLLIVVYYQTKRFHKYYAKTFLYYGTLVVVTAVTAPAIVFRPNSFRNSELFAALLRKATRLFSLKYIVEGAEHLPKDQPFIIVSNHQTPLDFLGQAACYPAVKDIVITSNRMFTWIAPAGILGYLAGVIFIETRYSRYTKMQLNRAIERMKKEKCKLWFFPEGGLNTEYSGRMRPFKKGAFHCAVKAQVPIVPIVFSPNTWYNRSTYRFEGGTVVARILPAFDTSNCNTPESLNELVAKVQNVMLEHFTQLKNVV